MHQCGARSSQTAWVQLAFKYEISRTLWPLLESETKSESESESEPECKSEFESRLVLSCGFRLELRLL